MINIIHSLAIIIGVLAYYFSDVNSSSGFSNTLLPLIAMLSFIYGVIVTVNMLYNLRKQPKTNDKAADILFQSMKELGDKKDAQQEAMPSDSSSPATKSRPSDSN